jgi:hypothetical protein
MNEPTLIHAIETSGYPLQGVVADKLKSAFGVTEEWGYIDRDTHEHRSLDVFAFKRLLTDGDVQPSLVLLIECKRSIHPYVFFRDVVDRQIPRFPQIAGLTRSAVTIHESSGQRLRETTGAAMLGLAELPFVRPGPPHCCAFTMAIAQGDKVSVSGTDPFNSVILPLVKAMDHAASLYKPDSDTTRLYPTLLLGVSVLDAPMLIVNSPREASAPVLMPWVRVRRQEAQPDRDGIQYMHYAVDVVHVEFFDQFIVEHLTPFTDQFVSRARKQSTILFKSGTVANLDNWHWDKVQPYRD